MAGQSKLPPYHTPARTSATTTGSATLRTPHDHLLRLVTRRDA